MKNNNEQGVYNPLGKLIYNIQVRREKECIISIEEASKTFRNMVERVGKKLQKEKMLEKCNNVYFTCQLLTVNYIHRKYWATDYDKIKSTWD